MPRVCLGKLYLTRIKTSSAKQERVRTAQLYLRLVLPGSFCVLASFLLFSDGKDVMGINAKEIGQRIKALRKERGLTQEGFAESVGLTVSAVSKIEIGDRVPSIDTFVLLSGFFGVSLDYIVLGKEH